MKQKNIKDYDLFHLRRGVDKELCSIFTLKNAIKYNK